MHIILQNCRSRIMFITVPYHFCWRVEGINLNSELFQGDDGLEAALWREADAQAQCYATADLMEGVNAVREKRNPEFTLYEDFKR